MLLPEAPLLVDEVDQALYIERPEAQVWLLAAATAPAGSGWLLLGPAGSGKTTLLNWFARTQRDRVPVARVDAGGVADSAELVGLIRESLRQVGASRLPPIPAPSEGRIALQAAVQELGVLEHSCVLLDNLENVEAGFDLFGRMRDLVWATRHSFVITGTADQIAALRRPPAAAFFAHAFELEPPDQRMLRALTDNARATPEQLHRLVTTPPPSMRAAVRYLNRPPQWAGEDAWRRQLSRLPTATALVAGRLLELDRPAAADDPELAERTGLGAIALRRHLRALEQAGLARRYAPRASNNPGRPRHVYEADIAEER